MRTADQSTRVGGQVSADDPGILIRSRIAVMGGRHTVGRGANFHHAPSLRSLCARGAEGQKMSAFTPRKDRNDAGCRCWGERDWGAAFFRQQRCFRHFRGNVADLRRIVEFRPFPGQTRTLCQLAIGVQPPGNELGVLVAHVVQRRGGKRATVEGVAVA
jgi:hypothetical protein